MGTETTSSPFPLSMIRKRCELAHNKPGKRRKHHSRRTDSPAFRHLGIQVSFGKAQRPS